MGTRADFYIGRGESAEWLGSIAWDGYPDGIDKDVLTAITPVQFKMALGRFFASRDDVTLPEQGWPWPWDDSGTTDFAYALDGAVWASSFGGAWFVAADGEPQDEDGADEWVPTSGAVFPNMADRKKVTYGSRSGVMVIGPGGPIPAAAIDADEAAS
jgi:hypothetical protein